MGTYVNMLKSLYKSLLLHEPKAKTFRPAERRGIVAGSSSFSSGSSSSDEFYLAGRGLGPNPYQSSLSPHCTLPATTTKFRVPQVLDDEQLESIQARSSKWKKDLVSVRQGSTIASRVWVTVDDKDYMLEEISGNGLTEAFTTDSPVHVSVLLILSVMVRTGVSACYVWNLPGARSAGPGRDICMKPRSYKPRPP